MGSRKRVRIVGVWDVPGLRRRGEMDAAVDRIIEHLRATGRPGIYTGAGDPYTPTDDPAAAPRLLGPDRVHRGPAADGSDTYLLVEPDEDPEVLRDRIYPSRAYATVGMDALLRIADTIYAAIGLGAIDPAPAAAVEARIDAILTEPDEPRLGRTLAADCWLLRDWLGLPTRDWPADTTAAAERGRHLCATLRRR